MGFRTDKGQCGQRYGKGDMLRRLGRNSRARSAVLRVLTVQVYIADVAVVLMLGEAVLRHVQSGKHLHG